MFTKTQPSKSRISFRRGGRVTWKIGKRRSQIALPTNELPTSRASQRFGRSASSS